MEYTKTKKRASPQPQPQWRLRVPVSKADKDAIYAFQRALKSRDWIVEQLKAAQLKVKEGFELLQKRGQIEPIVPVTDTAHTTNDTQTSETAPE